MTIRIDKIPASGHVDQNAGAVPLRLGHTGRGAEKNNTHNKISALRKGYAHYSTDEGGECNTDRDYRFIAWRYSPGVMPVSLWNIRINEESREKPH